LKIKQAMLPNLPKDKREEEIIAKVLARLRAPKRVAPKGQISLLDVIREDQ
jgi:hypothetical protein